MGSTFYYFCFAYLPIFLNQQMAAIHTTSHIISLFVALMIIFIPCAGYLCDCIGRRRMLLIISMLIIVLVAPGYYLLHFSNQLLTIVILLIFTLISSLEQGTTSIAAVENFPPSARCTGLSLGYNLGNGLLGGTVPIVCTWLVSSFDNIIFPAFYIMGCAAITGLVVYFFVPETAGRSLEY